VKALAPSFQQQLRAFASRRHVAEVRGVSLIGAIELAADPAKRVAFDPARKAGARLAELALEQGLIVRAMGDAIAFCPPLIVSAEQVADLFARFDRAMTRFEAMFTA
jgi:4-aminobutyrate--pyruvate transaminase